MPYITVAQSTESEIIIEKSRFIAHVFPAPDEETAKDHIRKIAKQHWNANHNCYAYIIGENGHIQKASDDGEPSGTAGVPILEVIKKNGLTDTLIIVTRYFGGVKLGAGGLVRAYSQSASNGIRQASIVEKVLHQYFDLTVDYGTWSKIENRLEKIAIINDRTFTDKVTVSLAIPANESEFFIEQIKEITSGKGHLISRNIKLINSPISSNK